MDASAVNVDGIRAQLLPPLHIQPCGPIVRLTACKVLAHKGFLIGAILFIEHISFIPYS